MSKFKKFERVQHRYNNSKGTIMGVTQGMTGMVAYEVDWDDTVDGAISHAVSEDILERSSTDTVMENIYNQSMNTEEFFNALADTFKRISELEEDKKKSQRD
ncbi:hypothetical protein FK481_0056 [Listeria phage LP-010]|uniref:Uncharacterized protein n=3 Tax=Homburgvirus LP114 TaxID=1921129 RepID=A0A059T7L6_9CAUD|nr:hypothetical protein LP114_048 [Listeria phage LP-114]AHL18636.1 hypothetical protein LP114_048 [Listeria phage LP-114]QDK04570.1 hypothetical protein FK481_0056 [Listeria phage LP-010]QDK04679.1 hypothetical protein FK482_0057 [Listeria phage LP-013]